MPAAVGDLVPTTTGKWMVLAPTHCPNGHELIECRVGYQNCRAVPRGGHYTWTCWECDATVHGPPIVDECQHTEGVRCDWRAAGGGL